MKIRINSEVEISPYLRSTDPHEAYGRARRDPRTDQSAYVLTAMIGGTGGFNGPEAAFDLKDSTFITTRRLRGPSAWVQDDALIQWNSIESHDGQPSIAKVALQPWNISFDRNVEQEVTEVFFTPESNGIRPLEIATHGLWLLMSGQVDTGRSLDLKAAAASRRTHADLEASRQAVHKAFKEISKR